MLISTRRWLADFQAALAAHDQARLQALFADERYWRDFLAFTWNIVTLEGRQRVWDILAERLGGVTPFVGVYMLAVLILLLFPGLALVLVPR